MAIFVFLPNISNWLLILKCMTHKNKMHIKFSFLSFETQLLAKSIIHRTSINNHCIMIHKKNLSSSYALILKILSSSNNMNLG